MNCRLADASVSTQSPSPSHMQTSQSKVGVASSVDSFSDPCFTLMFSEASDKSVPRGI
jgi:hypothetical protein